MSWYLRSVAWVICGATLCGGSARLFAQEAPPAAGPGAPDALSDQFSGKGTIESISGHGDAWIKITSGGQPVMLHCTKATKVKVTGTVLPDYLKAGVHLRFSALVDKKAGKLKEEKIGKFTVFAPSKEHHDGAFPDKSSKDEAQGEFKPYDLAGVISGVKGSEITLSVPGCGGKLHFHLDENPEIDFIAGDLSAAKPGDSVDAQGTKVAQMGQMSSPTRLQQSRMLLGGTLQSRMMQERMMQGQMMQGAQQAQAGGLNQPGSGGPQVVNVAEINVVKSEPLSGKKHLGKATAKAGHGKAEKAEPAGELPLGLPPVK